MKVEVQLFGFLLKYAPPARECFEIDLPDGSALADLVRALNIPTDEPRQSLVNGSHAPDERVLKDGDQVALLTPAEGG